MDSVELYKKMLDDIMEGIYFVDADRTITFWNKGAERISGFSSDEVVGRHCFDNLLNHVDEAGNKLCLGGCPLHATIMDGSARESLVYLHHKLGHRVAIKVKTTPIVEDGLTVGAVEMFIGYDDDFRSLYEIEELKQLAFRDQLTGLANRRYLDKHLNNQIALTNQGGRPLALAFLDIDHFKRVNDTYGHLAGDEMLKVVAKTLNNGFRAGDLVGRWGGEEFVCILNVSDEAALMAACEKARMLVENCGIRDAGGEIRVTISIGATLYRLGEGLEALTSRADQLLYRSKSEGRNRVSIG